eukprot:495316-Pyramimonas_sp.AAC.1
MHAKRRAKYCSGLRSATVRARRVAGEEIVEKVIRDTGPLRGRAGADLARALLYIIGAAFACPVSSDTVARPDWEPPMAKDNVERNPGPVAAYTSSSTHHVIGDCFSGSAQDNGPVTVALGHEPACSSLEVTGALNSHLESGADVAS